MAWGVPSSNGGSAITGYDLDYKLSSSSNWSNTTHSGTGRTFTITSLTNGSDYDIRVAAINNPGTGSYVTGTAAPVAAATAPDPPTGLTLTPGDTQIALSWTAPADNGGSALTGYSVQYSSNSGVTFTGWTHNGTGTSDTITGLTNGQSYQVRVAAINSQGTGSYVTGTTTPVAAVTVPDAPTGLTLTPSDTQIAVAWTAPADNGGSAITGYDLDYKLSSSSNWSNTTHSGTGRTFTITSITNGLSYQVRVAAINNQGTGGYVTGTTTLADRPDAPTSLTFTPGDTQIALSWTAPADNGGSTITGYDVEYRSGISGAFTGASHTGTTTAATITGLTNGQSYQVQVRAKNSYGAGPWSALGSSAPIADLILTDFSTANLGVEASALITVGASGHWYGISPRTVSGSLLDGDLNLSSSNEPIDNVQRDPANVIVNNSNAALDLSAYFGPSGDGARLRMWLQSATDGSDLVHSTGTFSSSNSYIRFTFSGGPPSFSANERVIVAFASPDPPSAPAAPTLTISGSGTIDVVWLPPTSSGYSSITDYDVQYKETLVTGWTDLQHTGTVRSASITGLTNGTSYDVQVRASNADATGPWSATSVETPANLGGPGAPAPPTLTSGDQQISVAWLEPSDNGGSAIDGYDVEWRQGTEGNWTDLNHTGLVRSAVITGLTNGQEYQVQVRANNSVASGNWSGTTQATPSTTPAQIKLLGVAVKSESLIASWSAPADNGATISDYDVQYRQGNTGAFSPWGHVGTAAFATITGLTNGQEYEIQVRAENSNGDGPWSASATGTPADFPDAPATPTITSQDTTLTASWTAPANNGGPITGYDVEYREGTEGDWEVHTHLGTGATATITGLRNGQPYQVQVRGRNVRGAGLWSQAGLGTPYGAMGPPTNVTLTPSNEEIIVEWEPPTQTGGRVVTSYRVVHYVTSSGSASATGENDPLSLNLRTKTITGLANGTAYSVYVFATYAGGSGTHSSTEEATPVPPPPGAPSDLAQTPGDAQIALAWTAPSVVVTSYDYSTDDGVSWRTTGSAAASYTATHTSASTSTALVNGTEYTFRVRGRNTSGVGPQSNSIKATPRTVPAQVVISGTTHGDEEVTITWTAPSDGGSTITRYDYRIGSAGSAQGVGNADINTTSITIVGLLNGTEYQLYVRAANAAGDGPWSAPSAETPSTTPGAPLAIVSVSGNAEVDLSWTAPLDDGGIAITGYDYSTDGGVSWKTTGSTATLYTVTHTSESTSTVLVNNTEYIFRVRAVNSNGAGAPSQPSTATPHEPPSVSGVAAASVSLTTATTVATIQNSFGVESTVEFEYKKGSASNWQAAGSVVGVTSSSYDITGLTPNTAYDIRARIGTTTYATGSFTTEANHTTGVDVTSSTGTAVAITVSFTNPLSATTNVYLRSKRLSGQWSATATNSESGTTSTFTIINLTPGTDYQVEASLDSSFPSAATVSIDFDPGAELAADSEFITEYVEIIVTPEDPVPASGSATGFRKGELSVGFGEVDPETIAVFGSPFDVLAIRQTGMNITFSISPCPTTSEMHSMRIEELDPTTMATTSSVSVISLRYFCNGGTATWTAAGVTEYALGGTSSGGTTNDKKVTLRLQSLSIRSTQSKGEISVHRRGTLKGTICALPEMILGEGFCGPLMIFFPPLMLIGVAFAFGVVNPVALSGIGLVAFTGMAAIVLPGPIMVVGFILAAAGAVAGMAILRR